MPRRIKGYALLEQITVIAAVGATSTVALPRLIEIRPQAEAVALQHLAGAAGSAMLVNYGGCLVTNQQAVPGKCRPVADCSAVTGLLHGGLPEGYRIEAAPLGSGGAASNGAEGTCTVVQLDSGARLNFTGLAAGL